jgi:hypothetical protein
MWYIETANVSNVNILDIINSVDKFVEIQGSSQ